MNNKQAQDIVEDLIRGVDAMDKQIHEIIMDLVESLKTYAKNMETAFADPNEELIEDPNQEHEDEEWRNALKGWADHDEKSGEEFEG